MVNNTVDVPSTKARLLAHLRRRRGEPVSGETVAAEAGVSRVAVWKAAEALRTAGYGIRSSGQEGYVLDPAAGDDFLYPWEFPGREHLVRHWTETDSTMDRARELAERGIGSGALAVAETQTAGRGRSGRSWRSPEGGLFFTLLERPELAVADYGRLPILAQIAAAEALRDTVGAVVRLRWPNDLYVRGKKIAGVLTELRGAGDRLAWVTLGIGINVNNGDGAAVSCRDLAGRFLSRREILLAFLDRMELLRQEAPGPGELAARWNALADGRGGRFAAVAPDHGGHGTDAAVQPMAAGRFLGMDRYGRAVLETPEGKRRYAPGSASLIPA